MLTSNKNTKQVNACNYYFTCVISVLVRTSRDTELLCSVFHLKRTLSTIVVSLSNVLKDHKILIATRHLIAFGKVEYKTGGPIIEIAFISTKFHSLTKNNARRLSHSNQFVLFFYDNSAVTVSYIYMKITQKANRSCPSSK